MKHIFYHLIIFCFSFSGLQSQDANASRDLLNRTETSIYKAQKEMIAGNSTKKIQELSEAVNYQVLAIQFYNNNDFKSAICFSVKSREYTNRILTSMNLKNASNYNLNPLEIDLAKSVNYNSQDELYKTKLLTKYIDESILFDAQKLREHYKISIN